MKYIYHHLGLGDHIICNGLVRCMINPNEKYTMFVKEHNLDSVRFMYKDLKNLTFLVGDDDFAKNFIHVNNISKENLIIAGFGRHPNSKEFDDSFYLQNNIDFNSRWSNFKCERDYESEKTIFNKFGVKEGEYVFIHDDKSRGYEIDESYVINKDLPIIRPVIGYTKNSFDYCYLMQHSKESHFMDSSFRLIFDSFQLRNNDLFFHLNLKNNINRGYKPHSKLNFTII
jgi:hypothetical protein